MMELNGKQRRQLRALAHALDPVVILGKHGLTDSVTAQVDTTLGEHELIKIKFGKEFPDDRDESAAAISLRTDANIVARVGGVVTLYRPHPENPRIRLVEGKRK